MLGIANFLGQYHHYLTAYILSTFLVTFVGEGALGYVFAGASLATAFALLVTPSLFVSFGTRNVLGFLALAEIGVLLGLSVASTPTAAVVLFILQSSLTFAIFIGIDLLIEASTKRESETGNTRGIFLTITNVAVVAATYSLTLFIAGDDYIRVFNIAALVLVPFAFMAFQLLRSIPHVAPPKAALISSAINQLRSSSTLRNIFASHFLLQIFFSWMMIYSPILLHDYINFSWSDIGLILTFAMLPYIVLEYPLGWVADHWLGEKELLTIGFIIVALSCIVMAFIDGVSLYAWIAVMVFSRIGAAMIECMTETHFFKQVDVGDPAAISAFRILRPLGGVLAPILASIALIVLPLPYIFAVFGVILFLGVPVALSITDSK